MKKVLLALCLSLSAVAVAPLVLRAIPEALAAAPTQAEMVNMLKVIDDRQQNSGDYKSLIYIQQKSADKADLIYEGVVYRRDEADKLVILFLKPASEAGKGYLRVDSNLFMYDPTVGKWERRTERERIGGTGGQRADFDQSRLAIEYSPAFVADEKLGAYNVHHLKMTANEGVDVAYPVVEMWIDSATGNTMKKQDFALSGKLMRTTYYPSWQKIYSPSKKADVYFPKEIRIFDEVEQGTSTVIVIQQVDLSVLDDSIFTKAWLESKSR
jgi:hypothetical protein